MFVAWHDSHCACTHEQFFHYSDVMMGAMASQNTGVSVVYSTVCSGADQRKYQSSASLAFVRGIRRSPADSLHQGPITRKMFPFDDVIMVYFKAKPHGCCIFSMILHEAPSMETTTPKGEWFPCWVAEWSIMENMQQQMWFCFYPSPISINISIYVYNALRLTPEI